VTAAGYDAIVLAGGSAARMGTTDKPGLDVDGTTLLDRVLAAVAGAGTVVVVGGDPRPTQLAVTWTREQPVGTGPAAAARAGLDLVTAATVLLLAADLPFLTVDAVDRLLVSVGRSGAVLVDGDGREQWLAGAWRSDVLRAADLRPGGPLWAALAPLHPTHVPAQGNEVLDCDTPQDLARARELA
jgi:molybdopterin-guanine dinucleotide biosynthesis protein A